MTDTPAHKPAPLVFTDLDGTLLDHDTYGFEPALPALHRLQTKKIPVIINSSKTLIEIVQLRRALNNDHPFIAENGSVVAVPTNYFPDMDLVAQGFQLVSGVLVKRLGGDRDTVLEILSRLRNTIFSFEGFADMSPARLSEVTGLNEKHAMLAGQRLSTEPILWHDTAKKWNDFCALLAENGLGWVQGGRFISISRPFDKKDGVAFLLNLYSANSNIKRVCIGLGDSPNDQAMLDMMDIAVVICSARSSKVEPQGAGTVIRTTRKGPRGWQEAMDTIFSTL